MSAPEGAEGGRKRPSRPRGPRGVTKRQRERAERADRWRLKLKPYDFYFREIASDEKSYVVDGRRLRSDLEAIAHFTNDPLFSDTTLVAITMGLPNGRPTQTAKWMAYQLHPHTFYAVHRVDLLVREGVFDDGKVRKVKLGVAVEIICAEFLASPATASTPRAQI